MEATRAVDPRTSQLRWTVIPAQPGTRLEWDAKWCEAGTVPVHAWLIPLDIAPAVWDDSAGYGYVYTNDTSCALGYPMILDCDGHLADARFVDLDGKPGSIIEPEGR